MSDEIRLTEENTRDDRPATLYELVSVTTQAAIREQALAAAVLHILNGEQEIARLKLKEFIERVDGDLKALVEMMLKEGSKGGA